MYRQREGASRALQSLPIRLDGMPTGSRALTRRVPRPIPPVPWQGGQAFPFLTELGRSSREAAPSNSYTEDRFSAQRPAQKRRRWVNQGCDESIAHLRLIGLGCSTGIGSGQLVRRTTNRLALTDRSQSKSDPISRTGRFRTHWLERGRLLPMKRGIDTLLPVKSDASCLTRRTRAP